MNITLAQAYSFHQIGKRGNQEDARWPDTDMPERRQRFFIVCDGVGGSEGGETASQTVCESFGASISSYNLDKDFTNKDFSRCLDMAYAALDNAKEKGGHDMATTLTIAVFHGEGCTLAHIGDSRIYQIRPSQGIVYRSDDHSLVNQMVHSGIITPEEAESHPQKNIITRYMGPVEEDQSRCMATVTRTSDIQAGDYFLLCTDGVLQRLNEEWLLNLLKTNQDDEEKTRKMAERCKDSSDNNTACLIRVEKVLREEPTDKELPQETCHDTRRDFINTTTIEEVESVRQPPRQSALSQFFKRFFH